MLQALDIRFFQQQRKRVKERQAVRAVNASLESDPQAYTETFDHSDYRIAIYLKPSEIGGGLPAEIGAVYLSNSNIYQYRSYAIAVGIAGLVLSHCPVLLLNGQRRIWARKTNQREY